MSDFPFRIVGDAAQADKAIDKVLDGLDEIKRKANDTGKGLDNAFLQAADGMKKADAQSAAIKKSLADYGPIVGNATSMFDKLKSGISSVARAMAPFNQAFELGGKLFRVAGAGLDAYAKTSATAEKQVKALKEEFSKYRDTVMAGLGQLTVAILGSANAWETMARKQALAANPKLAKYITSEGNLTKEGVEAGISFGILKRETSPADALSRALDGVKASGAELFGEMGDKWDPTLQRFGENWKKHTDDYADAAKKAAEAQKKPVEDAGKTYQALLEEITGPEQAALERLNMLELAYKNADISLEQYNAEIEKTRSLLVDMGSIKVPSVAGALGAPTDYTAGISGNQLDASAPTPQVFDKEGFKKGLADLQQAAHETNADLAEGARKAAEDTRRAWADALIGISDSFIDAAFAGEQSFGDMVEQMLEDLSKLIIKALVAKAILSALGVPSVPGAAGGLGSLLGFADGGRFYVGGAGGTDQNLVAFRASNNERVTVETPEDVRSGRYFGGGRGTTNIVIMDDPRQIVSGMSTRAGEAEFVHLDRKFRRQRRD